MGFDQYHEPPEELPPATRTFARLCASLTEEAEAIGWYEQRLAVEPDPEAQAIMRDAQGEEFKHFSMDLEFLLRRTPLWREIAEGRALPARRHRRARRGGRGRGDRGRRRSDAAARRRRPLRLARHRQPQGRRCDEPPAALARADHRLGLGAARRRGQASASRPRWPRASSSTSPARAAGSTRRPTSGAPTAVAKPPGRRRHRASAARAAAGRAAGRLHGLARRAARRRPRRARRRPRAISTAPPTGSRSPRTSPSSTAGRRPGSPGSPRPRRTRRCRSAENADELPALGGAGGRAAAAQRASPAPTGWRSAATSTPAWSRPPSTAAIRCSTTCARSSKGPIVWAPGVKGAVVLSLRGGDFLFESGQDLSIGYERHDEQAVHLYLEESFSFVVATPEAAVPLTP